MTVLLLKRLMEVIIMHLVLLSLTVGLATAQECRLQFSCAAPSASEAPFSDTEENPSAPTAYSPTVEPTAEGTAAGSALSSADGSEYWSAFPSGNPYNSFTEDVCSHLLTDFLKNDALNLEKHAEILSNLPPEYCVESYQAEYSHCFWCSPEAVTDENYCTVYDRNPCEVPLEERTKLPYADSGVGDVIPICYGYLISHIDNDARPASIENCELADEAWATCNFCSPDIPYLGADTQTKKAVLAWLPRVSAVLSMLGASYILWDVCHASKRTVYHGLLFFMAVFDFCTAGAWAFTTAPIPTIDLYTDYVYGVAGNDAFCKAQAFFIQLGVASVFYNAALATYYWLVIVRGWTEHRLQKPWPLALLHGPPLIIGLALAFGGLAKYDFVEYGCHLYYASSEDKGQYLSVTLLFLAPIGASIVYITFALAAVYWKVRRLSRKTLHWSLRASQRTAVSVRQAARQSARENSNSTMTLERRVFWQCVSFAMAFYITWPLIFLNYAMGLDFELDSYAYTLIVATLAPLQGFNNWLVYVRPRWASYMENRKKQRIKAQKQSEARASSSQDSDTMVSKMETPASLSHSTAYAWNASMEPSVMIAADEANVRAPPENSDGDDRSHTEDGLFDEIDCHSHQDAGAFQTEQISC